MANRSPREILEAARGATERRDWPLASELFRELARADPDHASHWNNLALAEIRGGRGAPINHQRRAVLLRPDEANYLNNLSAGERGEDRARLIEWLLALRPDHARARADQAFHLLQVGQTSAALRAARLAHVVAPGLPENLGRGAQALLAVGDVGRAVIFFRRYSVLDPGDRIGVRRDLARIGALDTDQAMSPDFVAGVFDGYSESFDEHLTGTLGYVGPRILGRLLDGLSDDRGRRAVDLGCGSGLSGVELRRFADHLTGVDLSGRMLERARERGLYDELYKAEVVSWLRGNRSGFDIAMAADVTSYIGDLAPFFEAVSEVLSPAGLLAMTVHERDEEGFGIAAGDTYSHSFGYVETTARASGLRIIAIERGAMRMERKHPLPTMFLVLGKS